MVPSSSSTKAIGGRTSAAGDRILAPEQAACMALAGFSLWRFCSAASMVSKPTEASSGPVGRLLGRDGVSKAPARIRASITRAVGHPLIDPVQAKSNRSLNSPPDSRAKRGSPAPPVAHPSPHGGRVADGLPVGGHEAVVGLRSTSGGSTVIRLATVSS